MTRNLSILSALVLTLIAILLFAGNFSINRQRVAISHPIYAADFGKDEILVGASHNVFIGKVLTQSGNKERGFGPETQFDVQIIKNIKGDLDGVVTVNQQGGYKNGTLHIVSETNTTDASNYLLKQDRVYIFATRYNERENWHTLNSHPSALKELGEYNPSKDGTYETDSRAVELTNAYSKEQLIQADMASGNTRNNYLSKSSEVE